MTNIKTTLEITGIIDGTDIKAIRAALKKVGVSKNKIQSLSLYKDWIKNLPILVNWRKGSTLSVLFSVDGVRRI